MTTRQPPRIPCHPTVLASVALTVVLMPSAVAGEAFDVRDLISLGGTPLHRAAAAGDVDAIADLLDAGAPLEARDERGFTPLLTAVATGTPESVRALLDAGAETADDGPRRSWYGLPLTPLNLAGRRGDVSILRELMPTGVSYRELGDAASAAITTGNEEAALWLLRAKPTRITAAPRNEPLIWQAHRADQLAVLELLLEQGMIRGGHQVLVEAAMTGRVETVDLILHHGFGPETDRYQGWTALGRALQAGHVDIARRLLEAGASKTARMAGWYTILHAAAASGDVKIVRELLDGGALVNARARAGHTPLDIAELHRCREVASLLRERGGVRGDAGSDLPRWLPSDRIRSCGSRGAPAPDRRGPGCLQAAALGDPEPLEACLLAGREPALSRLLEQACRTGDAVAAAVMVRHVDDVNDLTFDGTTPLDLAVRSGHGELVRIFLDAGADPNVPNGEGRTTLHVAAGSAEMPGELIRLFLDAGADPNIPDDEGRTALHVAAGSGDVQRVDLLLAAGADAQLETDSCASTLHFAAISGPAEVVQRLWAGGADASRFCTGGARALLVDSEPITSQIGFVAPECLSGAWPIMQADIVTPMHVAALSNEADVIRELLALGHDPNVPSWRGATPLFIAVRYGAQDAAELLLDAGSDPNVTVPFTPWPGLPGFKDVPEGDAVLLTPRDLALAWDMKQLLEEHGGVRASALHGQ